MNKISNTKLVFACALFWALIFFVDELPSSNQFSDWLEVTLAVLIFPFIPATLLAWIFASLDFVRRQKRTPSVYLANVLTGLSLPLIASGYLLLSSDSTFSDISNYTMHNWIFSELRIESFFNYNVIVILSFLMTYRDLHKNTVLVGWTNGNLAIPLLFAFWPRSAGEIEGWTCNGEFLSESDGFLGFNCAGKELNLQNISTFLDHMQVTWGLDKPAFLLVDLIDSTCFIIAGLIALGSTHFVLKKPNFEA